MTRSDYVLREMSKEIARWVISGVAGGCIAIWSTLLTMIIYPSILDLQTRNFLRFFFYSVVLSSLFFYLFCRFYLEKHALSLRRME